MSEIRYHEDKFSELILYVSQKSVNDPRFGATKLNKILYFSDFLAYGNWGEAITGAEYQNLPQGPAPRRLLPVRSRLVTEGALEFKPVRLFSGNVQQRTIPLREADLTLFNGREIALVDEIIQGLYPLTADQASDLSHLDVAWKSTQEGETIPYGTVFLSDARLTEAEIARAREIAREEGMAVA